MDYNHRRPHGGLKWLTPAAFVYHGGIGTSAQAMASATPQLVTPFSHDQPDNAARMEALGIARSISAGRYTGTRAAGLLSTLIESPAIAAACRDTASRFVGADATSRACDVIERLGASSR
jgi:rhamnosyltransferase subunit B